MRRIGRGGIVARARAIGRGLATHVRLGSREPRRTLVVGHRGAARDEAENTLPSFALALERGADAVEADISITRDGRFVVWHDADPDERVALIRQAGLEKLRYRPEVPDLGSPWRRPVRELTLEELRRHYRYVRADDDDGGGPASGARADWITLDELLEWAADQNALTDLFLDVKLDEMQTREAGGLVEMLRQTTAESRGAMPVLHLLSPCEPVIREMSRRWKEAGSSDSIRVSADFELPGASRLAPRTGAPDVSLGCGERFWTGFRADVEACIRERDRGVFGHVVAWTISDEKKLRHLVRDGVDGILTDDAALLRSIVESASPGVRRQHRDAERGPSSLRSSG